MSIELKLFIDGIEVKKGDRLIRGSNVITFDRIKRDGEIVDSEGRLWTNYIDYFETWSDWKFHKKPLEAIKQIREINGSC